MTNEEKTNGTRRDYKKVRRVSSIIILNLLNNISEERKTEIRNKMLDELNNEEYWTSHYAPGIIAPSQSNANELIGLNLRKLRGGSSLNTMNKPTHVSSLNKNGKTNQETQTTQTASQRPLLPYLRSNDTHRNG